MLQREGVDPDPLGLDLDVDRIIESYTDKEKLLHIESQVCACGCAWVCVGGCACAGACARVLCALLCARKIE